MIPFFALLPACVDSTPDDEAEPIAGAATGSLTATGCITDVSAGQHTFSCDGVDYAVRLPARCTSGGCGVIVDIHGLTLDATIEDANTNMRAIGEREGYVVIQPNAGKAPFSSWVPSVHNAKVWAFLTSARMAFNIDPKRVHVTGFSQGAIMAWTFACEHADVVASAAPIAYNGCTQAQLTAAKRQVPILYVHGKDDAIASFAFKATPQKNAVVRAWNMGLPKTVARDANYKWSRYTNKKGTVFEFIEHEYTAPSSMLDGHCFPGSTDNGSSPGALFSFACKAPNAFVYGEEVVKFFKAHPLP